MKVIIADDDPTTRVVLSSLVGKMGYETILAEDGEAAWQAYLKQDTPCLLLLDWEMPKIDGAELCQKVKAHSESKLNPPYLILVTGRTDPKDIVTGLGQGADDYICKPFNAPELQARIQVARRTLELHQELYEMRRILKYQATHDDLTGLLNRRAAIEALNKEVHRAERAGNKLHVAICDIDNFKRINDTYGHFVGDQVLQSVSQTMQGIFRPYDLVARYGGEEFLIAISDKEETATDAFSRLLQEISSLKIPAEGHDDIQLTLSLGLSSRAQSLSEKTVSEMLIEADRRLYQAKAAGKNCIIAEG